MGYESQDEVIKTLKRMLSESKRRTRRLFWFIVYELIIGGVMIYFMFFT